MCVEGGIFWLASYPKSGNTWFRIVLANLLNANTKPVDINHLTIGTMASGRAWVDDALGIDSTYLSYDELDQLRPTIYRWYAKQSKQINYNKIHDAYVYLKDGTPLIPIEGCLGALYFIRNPLDVAISFANHSNCAIDLAIKIMGEKDTVAPLEINRHKQLRQHLLSWSLHVESWTTAQLNLLALRYEDMVNSPLESFKKAIDFLEINTTEQLLKQALEKSSFKNLQIYEASHGFNENPTPQTPFFRKGIVGDWQAILTKKQISQIIADHETMMYQYGYLDKAGCPVIE